LECDAFPSTTSQDVVPTSDVPLLLSAKKIQSEDPIVTALMDLADLIADSEDAGV
jgi:hypothetical protein